jgi:hypothetical protein
VNPNPPFWSNPLQYILTGKPSAYQVNPFNYGSVAASQLSGTNQMDYVGVPGQVLYGALPANATPVNMTSVNISAIDSQSILDRSDDIAAAVNKAVLQGNGLSQTLQNTIFGP